MTSAGAPDRTPVAVTGMGVITSLGIGKADNWRRLTAGESGIRSIRRFATEGLKTTIAGTVDFITVEPFCSAELGERIADMVVGRRLRNPGSAPRVTFPVLCSSPLRRSRSSGCISNPSPRQRAQTTR
jgi:3-oxoacyl-[acyl-carrier-protein] synthase II